jgi:hypothetical protein
MLGIQTTNLPNRTILSPLGVLSGAGRRSIAWSSIQRHSYEPALGVEVMRWPFIANACDQSVFLFEHNEFRMNLRNTTMTQIVDGSSGPIEFSIGLDTGTVNASCQK